MNDLMQRLRNEAKAGRMVAGGYGLDHIFDVRSDGPLGEAIIAWTCAAARHANLALDLEQAADALEQQAAEQAECESGCGPATPWRQEATALRDALERIRTILVNDGRGWQNTSALTDIEKVVDAALEGR